MSIITAAKSSLPMGAIAGGMSNEPLTGSVQTLVVEHDGIAMAVSSRAVKSVIVRGDKTFFPGSSTLKSPGASVAVTIVQSATVTLGDITYTIVVLR